MSKYLVENIIAKNFVVAESEFRDRLETIKEQKLFEMKRMMQAEAAFPAGIAGVKARREAGFVRASEVLGDPTAGRKGKSGEPKKKAQTPADEWKGMRYSQRKAVVKHVRASVEKALAARDGEKAPETVSHAAPKAAPAKTPEVKIAPDEVKPKSSSTYKRPGIIKRNINTFQGREPGHVDNRTPEEKLKTKGGRLGKGLRAGLSALSSYGSLAE